LVDKNNQLVDALSKAGNYNIDVLGDPGQQCTIKVVGAYSVKGSLWYHEMAKASIVFTAVFGNNIAELAIDLGKALATRYATNPDKVLTIVTCENMTDAARVLKNHVSEQLGVDLREWLSEKVCFSESIIFRTCLEASATQDPLTIRAQNHFSLPCDGDAFKEAIPITGLKPLGNFKNQLKRKIYTYNCINAVISYLGASKGYYQLYEAGNDPEILVIARLAAAETCRAQVLEFGFDSVEQDDWMNDAFKKFADKSIPDPISRNSADPIRKISREDRLIGPALLAVKWGIHPEGLLTGIEACFSYKDDKSGESVLELINKKGIDNVLVEVCGLSPGEELFQLIKNRSVRLQKQNGKNH